MGSRLPTFSRLQLAFLIGTPVAWGILLLFHPTGDGDRYYPIIADQVTAWLTVHLGMMLFIPLMAGVVWLLLRGVEGTAARVSRIALAFFVVLYGAYEVLMGVGNGLLAHEVNQLSGSEQATGEQLIQDYSENVLIADPGVLSTSGSVALIVALVAAGIALRRHAGAPLAVPILFGLAAPLVATHVTPFGPTGLALVVAGILLSLRVEPSPSFTPHREELA